jgi:DNA-binding XRE family transcriptional regulator
MAFHHKLKKMREEKSIKQDLMAHKLGISQSAYSQIEDGSTSVKLYQCMKIAEIMGVSLEALLEDELKQMQVNCTNIQCHNQDCTNNYQTDKELFAEILKAKDETIATQKEALSTLKEIMGKN